jgi:hypothetical protein
MTFEHRMIAGLNDIKAVTFECNECQTRTSIPINKLGEAPRGCNSCKAVWWSAQTVQSGAYVTTSGPAIVGLVQAIVTMRVLMREKKDTVKILFEFEETDADAD